MKTATFVITVNVRDAAHADGVASVMFNELNCLRQRAQRVADDIPVDGWHARPRGTGVIHVLYRGGILAGDVSTISHGIVGRVYHANNRFEAKSFKTTDAAKRSVESGF